MKGLLATSTVFLHSKRRKKIAIHLIDRRTQKKMPDAFKQSGICNNWAMCAYSVIAPTGHSSMHVPQSMQESAFTVQTSATERASCGQASTQTPHATQSSALMVTAIFLILSLGLQRSLLASLTRSVYTNKRCPHQAGTKTLRLYRYGEAFVTPHGEREGRKEAQTAPSQPRTALRGFARLKALHRCAPHRKNAQRANADACP